MTIKEIQQQIITEFGNFDDWMDRYNHLIDMGKSCPLIDEKYKTKSFLISGCQSRVWLHASMSDGEIIFTADSDAVITKGIVNLLIRVFSKQPADDIIAADISFIDEIGLNEHLSPTRS
ncbi:MAG: SufE family protein, partial [Bacteroidales bacterium]|nr:SufE family protein [Bacteroidales bacterium]